MKAKKNTLMLVAIGVAGYLFLKSRGVIGSSGGSLTQSKMYDFLKAVENNRDLMPFSDWIASLPSYDQSLIYDVMASYDSGNGAPSWLSDWVQTMPV